MSATRLAAAGESAARPSARPGAGGRDREERRVRRPAVRPARESWRGDVRHPPGRWGRVRAAGASTPRREVESSGTFDHHFTRVRAVDSSLRRAQHVGALHTSIPPSQFYLWLLYMRQFFPNRSAVLGLLTEAPAPKGLSITQRRISGLLASEGDCCVIIIPPPPYYNE